MFRKLVSAAGSLLLVIGLLGFAPAPEGLAVQEAPGVGEQDLFNFEHVYNFNFAEYTDGIGQGGSTGQQGTDIEFFTTTVTRPGDNTPSDRDFAVVGDHSNGIFVFDITDPENVEMASYVTCNNPRADVGVMQIQDGETMRTFIGSSRESGQICFEAGASTTINDPDFNPLTSETGGIGMFDATNPYDVQPFARVLIGAGGAHNFAFHPDPTVHVAYAWNGEIGTAEISSIQIVDFTTYFATPDAERDVAMITAKVGPETVGSVHDAEFSPDGSIIYAASENNYEIFDNSDPLNPVLTTAFAPNEGTYAHGYFPTPDGNIAITNNESLALGGFFVGGTTVCPGEGLAFYDTSIEGTAVGPIGYYAPPVQGSPGTGESRACTSHFGRVVENNVVMTVGWYILGGRVVDFSNPTLPIEIGAATLEPTGGEFDEGTEAWTAKTYQGEPYMYVGDQGRGFDVFRWVGPEECGNPFDTTYDSECMVAQGAYRNVLDPTAPTNQSAFMASVAAASLATGNEFGRLGFSCQF